MVGTFKIGEKVVYPAHGVGVIEGVQTKVISGSERKFYMLRIIDSDMTIMIPTENVQSVGLRRIIGKDMVAKVYRILRDKKVEIDQQTWNRRYREYTEKIKTFLSRRIRRSEEHTSELQSRPHLVCRLLLEKKKKKRKE